MWITVEFSILKPAAGIMISLAGQLCGTVLGEPFLDVQPPGHPSWPSNNFIITQLPVLSLCLLQLSGVISPICNHTLKWYRGWGGAVREEDYEPQRSSSYHISSACHCLFHQLGRNTIHWHRSCLCTAVLTLSLSWFLYLFNKLSVFLS